MTQTSIPTIVYKTETEWKGRKGNVRLTSHQVVDFDATYAPYPEANYWETKARLAYERLEDYIGRSGAKAWQEAILINEDTWKTIFEKINKRLTFLQETDHAAHP
ncbi:MAG: hypothetical protein PHQ40_00275 [Anaerolineaceae bacterium]|nr:hypothetical protein [Anaerolineaceae bacterium]MDD5367491.1 hypothetical protein [Anaerolineaceae bacterium]